MGTKLLPVGKAPAAQPIATHSGIAAFDLAQAAQSSVMDILLDINWTDAGFPMPSAATEAGRKLMFPSTVATRNARANIARRQIIASQL
jgi:hypothetical protein